VRSQRKEMMVILHIGEEEREKYIIELEE